MREALKKKKCHVDVGRLNEKASSPPSLSIEAFFFPRQQWGCKHSSKVHVPAPKRGRQARAEGLARVGRTSRW